MFYKKFGFTKEKDYRKKKANDSLDTQFAEWRNNLLENGDFFPLKYGMKQADVIKLFGQPSKTSVIKNEDGFSKILKYEDIEFHFDAINNLPGLFLIYSDDHLIKEI